MRRAIATWRGQPWLGPEVLAATLAMVLIEAAAITRGFGLFVIVLFATPILWLITLACVTKLPVDQKARLNTNSLRPIQIRLAKAIGPAPHCRKRRLNRKGAAHGHA